MNKKPYEAPTVKTIRLEVRNAILAVCHTSTVLTPQRNIDGQLIGCNVIPICLGP
jgi:hypothetical protein